MADSQATKWTRTEVLLAWITMFLAVITFGLFGIISWCKLIANHMGVF